MILSREELRALLASPDAARILYSHHLVQVVLAESSASPGAADWHRKRAEAWKQYEAVQAAKIDAGCDPRPALNEVPTLTYKG